MKTLEHHEIPGRVTSFTGHGGLPAIRIETQWSLAEIYLLGAHVTRFKKTGEADLLFMSDASEFREGAPIRGGVPLIFPWFGPRDGLPAHGSARITTWDLVETRSLPDGSILAHFRMPPEDGCTVDFIVTVGPSLKMELIVANTDQTPFTFETCLHTYFNVRSIGRCAITGLYGTRFRDQLLATESTDTAEILRIGEETDRIYQDTAAAVEIHDSELRRTIRVAKSGSKSTVVWNPWIDKSGRMPDFGDHEYLHMLCVESGNVKENAVTLAPGESSALTVELDSVPL